MKLARIKAAHAWALILGACAGATIGLIVGTQIGVRESVAGAVGAGVATASIAALLGVRPFEAGERK